LAIRIGDQDNDLFDLHPEKSCQSYLNVFYYDSWPSQSLFQQIGNCGMRDGQRLATGRWPETERRRGLKTPFERFS
jgi:hypothetical protein